MRLTEIIVNPNVKTFKARHKTWPEWMYEQYDPISKDDDCDFLPLGNCSPSRTRHLYPNRNSGLWTRETASLHWDVMGDPNSWLEDAWEVWDVVEFEEGEERLEMTEHAIKAMSKPWPRKKIEMTEKDYQNYFGELPESWLKRVAAKKAQPAEKEEQQ